MKERRKSRSPHNQLRLIEFSDQAAGQAGKPVVQSEKPKPEPAPSSTEEWRKL